MVTDTIVLQPHGVSISTSRPFLRRTRTKLKLHAAEAGGIQKGVRGWLRFKLNLHTAEARWYPVSFHTLSVATGPCSLETVCLKKLRQNAERWREAVTTSPDLVYGVAV